MAIEVLPVAGEQFGLLDAVIALGDRYAKFLGLLTPPAYRKHADDGGLLAAVENEEVVGYALFGLPKRNHGRCAGGRAVDGPGGSWADGGAAGLPRTAGGHPARRGARGPCSGRPCRGHPVARAVRCPGAGTSRTRRPGRPASTPA